MKISPVWYLTLFWHSQPFAPSNNFWDFQLSDVGNYEPKLYISILSLFTAPPNSESLHTRTPCCPLKCSPSLLLELRVRCTLARNTPSSLPRPGWCTSRHSCVPRTQPLLRSSFPQESSLCSSSSWLNALFSIAVCCFWILCAKFHLKYSPRCV